MTDFYSFLFALTAARGGNLVRPDLLAELCVPFKSDDEPPLNAAMTATDECKFAELNISLMDWGKRVV